MKQLKQTQYRVGITCRSDCAAKTMPVCGMPMNRRCLPVVTHSALCRVAAALLLTALWHAAAPATAASPVAVDVERRDDTYFIAASATLRTDAPLFSDVDALRWQGPTPAFTELASKLGDARLLERCQKAAAKVQS